MERWEWSKDAVLNVAECWMWNVYKYIHFFWFVLILNSLVPHMDVLLCPVLAHLSYTLFVVLLFCSCFRGASCLSYRHLVVCLPTSGTVCIHPPLCNCVDQRTWKISIHICGGCAFQPLLKDHTHDDHLAELLRIHTINYAVLCGLMCWIYVMLEMFVKEHDAGPYSQRKVKYMHKSQIVLCSLI
jgi:hypothetical protein